MRHLFSWGFLACAGVAVGYGLWGLYGSGARLASLDAMAAEGATATLGPIRLEPGMSPVRVILRMGYAPVGSTRTRYRVALAVPAGARLWAREGAVGNRDDDASIVWTTTSLATFDVAGTGDHTLQVGFEAGTMDDLRGATIELRRNVTRVDGRITWGFGLAAALLLAANLVLGRRRPWPYRMPETPRSAA